MLKFWCHPGHHKVSMHYLFIYIRDPSYPLDDFFNKKDKSVYNASLKCDGLCNYFRSCEFFYGFIYDHNISEFSHFFYWVIHFTNLLGMDIEIENIGKSIQKIVKLYIIL